MSKKNWTRDEHILALDLYFREPSARGNRRHAEVVELSKLLQRLTIHEVSEREPHFRNPNGVGVKLSNFLRFDPDYEGEALPHGSKDEKKVWNEFKDDRERLARVAAAIRESVDHPELESAPQLAEDEEEASEGRTLTSIHKYRERSKGLAKKKKAAVLCQLSYPVRPPNLIRRGHDASREADRGNLGSAPVPAGSVFLQPRSNAPRAGRYSSGAEIGVSSSLPL